MKSIAAVVAGFATVVVLSLVTDEILHLLAVYPPWGTPMRDAAPNALALAYRSLFNVCGGYVCARLAPARSTRHVVALSIIGVVLGTLGVIAAIPLDLGPLWYPVGILLTAVPFTMLGAVVYAHRKSPALATTM